MELDRYLAAGESGNASSRLQAIVDEASRAVGRPVAIDDRHHRLVAHTQHGEDEVDRIRLMSIMKQPLPAELFEWLDRHGASTSQLPFRVPPYAKLEYDARVGAPMRCQGHHLGWLWCIDRDEAMTEADLEHLGTFADEAAVVLYRETLLQDLDRSRERELLRDMLSPDGQIRNEAAWQLAELDLFTASGRVAVLVIPLEGVDESSAPEKARVAVEALLMRVRRRLAPKHGLHLLRPSHALILASLNDPGIRSKGLAAFAAGIRDEIVISLPGRDDSRTQIVGVGGVARELTSAATSYDQALRAARVAATVSTFGEVVCWDDLGIYQMLTELPIDGFEASALHRGLRALLESQQSDELLPTLERFLDLAGNVQKTAAGLFLHRTTLYHRLRRIERIADVDLGDGDDRLALHLSLKIARLQGMSWPANAADDPGVGEGRQNHVRTTSTTS